MPRLVQLSCGYCIKPETSECNKCFHAIVKAQNFAVFRSPNYFWAVLKNRYLRPWVNNCHTGTWNIAWNNWNNWNNWNTAWNDWNTETLKQLEHCNNWSNPKTGTTGITRTTATPVTLAKYMVLQKQSCYVSKVCGYIIYCKNKVAMLAKYVAT